MTRAFRKDHTKLIIGVGFLGVFGLMLAITGLSMSTLTKINTDMATLVENTEHKTTRAYQMRDAIRQRSGRIRGLKPTVEATDKGDILNDLKRFTSTYQQIRADLLTTRANPRERAIIDDIAAAEAVVNEQYQSTIELAEADDAKPQDLLDAVRDVLRQEHVLLDHLNAFVQLEQSLAADALSANQQTYRQTRRVLLTIVVAAFTLSLLITAIVIDRVGRANRRIAHLATHDDLTGLHNRRSFEEHLQHTLALAARSPETWGLLYLDLDRFKIVNDTCGHHAGDQLLIELTRKIQSRLRRGDLFARLGGDEFAIIAQGGDFQAIERLAEDLRTIVSDYAFVYADQEFKVSLSIGLVPLDGHVSDIERVLADVDSACYVAKTSGRNRVHVATENDVELVKYRSDIAGVKAIRRALAQERLVLFNQPVFQLDQPMMQPAYCEILLRIRSEDGELYSPARFIPIAEKYNVMSEIDRWVVTHVTEWIMTNNRGRTLPGLLVNLSGLSLIEHEFADFIVERLQACNINPEAMIFEISESSAVQHFDKTRDFIARMRELGCRFALDDFGSGMSTFGYLKHLSVDFLKINGSLVSNMTRDSIDGEMVRAIHQIGHTIGAETIAEFVEDDDTLERLREIGVNYAQGFGLGVPVPLDDLGLLLDQWAHDRAEGELETYRKAS